MGELNSIIKKIKTIRKSLLEVEQRLDRLREVFKNNSNRHMPTELRDIKARLEILEGEWR